MSTTREGIHLLKDNLRKEHDLVIIQFGLVDSYSTFKYAPYVNYYPDNVFRKQLRSIVKKYKKSCRKLGLNRKYGEVPVVPAEEYEQNIRCMVRICKGKNVILPETIPNLQEKRNRAIGEYNAILKTIASVEENCTLLPLYDAFSRNMADYYQDGTHANAEGYDYIARRIVDLLG